MWTFAATTGRTLTLGFLVTSDDAVKVFRTVGDVASKEITRLGKLGVVVTPIQPNDPDEEYIQYGDDA